MQSQQQPAPPTMGDAFNSILRQTELLFRRRESQVHVADWQRWQPGEPIPAEWEESSLDGDETVESGRR
jgi:hypothetical protein